MTPLVLYLIKVNIALVLFCLAYRYGLRKLTFYTLNRFYLLFAIAFSSLYPLIDLSTFVSRQPSVGGEIIKYLPDLGEIATASPLEVWNLLAFVFWSGVTVMALRFAAQCISLARLHIVSRKQVRAEKRPSIRIVKEKVNPFSFFGSVYMNPLLHEPAERASIIRHEQVHTSQWHTLDILAGELNRVFYWFNPGAWLMMVAIRENLEFIADRKVLNSGIDARAYQYSLINVSEIPHASALANNFNFSHLKIRITMMDKKPSAELHLVKYLVLVPFIAATALAFNLASAGSPAADPATIPEAVTDTIPETSAGEKSETPPEPVVKQVRFAAKEAKEAKTPPKPVVKEIRLRSEGAGQDKQPFIVVDGEPAATGLNGIDPNDIESISVLKGEQATSLYGKKGENGVILVTSKENAATTVEQENSTAVEVSSEAGVEIRGAGIENALYVVDGEITSAEEANDISPDEIQSVSVLKDKSATDKYGEKGEAGVIEITTKD